MGRRWKEIQICSNILHNILFRNQEKKRKKEKRMILQLWKFSSLIKKRFIFICLETSLRVSFHFGILSINCIQISIIFCVLILSGNSAILPAENIEFQLNSPPAPSTLLVYSINRKDVNGWMDKPRLRVSINCE